MPYNKYTIENLAQGTISSTLSAGGTTLVLQAGQGGLFPSTFPFILKLEGFDTSLRVIRRNIVRCTNRSGDTLTIVRSFENAPANYSAITQTSTSLQFEVGDVVSLIVSKETIKDIQDEVTRLDTAKLNLSGGTLTGALKTALSSNIASATTTNLSSLTGNTAHITGTTTITSFGTSTGVYNLIFNGILTLTHNATSLILPTGANIITAVGDTMTVASLGGSNWRVLSYTRANGTALMAQNVGATKSIFVAGENITTGNALYISNGAGSRTSGRVYKASSLFTTYSDMGSFIGFATQTITTGNNITVDTAGINNNQTGLTIGADYFLTNTAGTISTTPGTNVICIGKAVSSTGIEINSFDKYNRDIYGKKLLIASNNINFSANTTQLRNFNSVGSNYFKIKEIQINNKGIIRTSFQIRNVPNPGILIIYGRIYVNGVAIGTERATDSSTFQTYVEDISVNISDLVQVYIRLQGVSNCQMEVRNFTIGYDINFIQDGVINLD